jgi:ketosteroid isomerase-like protein
MIRRVRATVQEDFLSESEARNIEVVLRYFDGCNSGDVGELLSTLDPDVRHYFLPPTFPPIEGAEHLANFWRRYKENLDPVWKIDHIIAGGDEVVSEWSCRWTNPASEARLMARGSEWYVMRDSKILEVRAYFIADVESNVELASFPYAERGYLPTSD